ncbi:MAG: DNA gyrase inhibitor YacG [Bryobacteraceae bacterium]
MKCPICKKKEVALGDPDFPFCSERCRVIDLANWASEKYVIPGPSVAPPEADEDEDE